MSTAPAPFAKQESGVSLGRTDTLPRYALCQDFMRELTLPGNGRAIIYAAPGSGKTSFGALLKDYLVTPTDNSTGRTQFQQDFNYGFPVVAHHISLRLAIGSNPRDYLRGAAGTNKVIFTGGVGPLFAPPAAGLKIIILDEGQMSYGDEWNDLWTEIMDARCDGQTGVCVVLLAAYGRRVITDIPPTPITFPVAYNGDFLKFSRSEVHDLYTRLNTTLSFAMPDESARTVEDGF
ncbi:hypothetical protein BC832DRAFT_425205 [Gaertneriomyces semiglobifer]|nr:hypothetical protein BC832DRAFT_425205 [Gaertneriomyces semiglobifer]